MNRKATYRFEKCVDGKDGVNNHKQDQISQKRSFIQKYFKES